MEATTHRINDPLSDVTRKVRRNVIVTSTVALIMIYANLLPSKIDSLGIKFDATHQSILVQVMFFSLLYLLISFLIYAVSDFLKWKIALTDLVLKERHTEIESEIEKIRTKRAISSVKEGTPDKEMEDIKLDDYRQKLSHELTFRTKIYQGPVAIVSVLRAAIDFIAPVIIGGFALAKLNV